MTQYMQEAVQFFKENLIPILADYVSQFPSEHSKRSSQCLNSIATPSFVLALVRIPNLLALIQDLSNNL